MPQRPALARTFLVLILSACNGLEPGAESENSGTTNGFEADDGAGMGEQPATDNPMDLDLPQGLPEPTVPEVLPEYGSEPLPAYATEVVERFDNTPGSNPITNDGAFLGRVLFYDRRLSLNGEVACASCHQQAHGFSDPQRLSQGFEGERTRRHSMSLVNLRYYEPGRMFWDERAETLEQQVLQPIQDPVEMGLSLDVLVARVSSTSYYAPLFEAAFGDDTVTAERIARALAQFVRSLTSFDSRFDQGMAVAGSLEADFPNFDASENRGKALFFGVDRPDLRGSCGVCHMQQNPLAPPPPNLPQQELAELNQVVFFMDGPRHNGLPEANDDDGFAEVTGDIQDEGKFKSSSLRDIALTAPYMHDGRFPTLQAVLDFYDRGVRPHPNLDPVLNGPGRPGIRLNGQERDDIIRFLRTLSGRNLLDDKFSSPFPE